MRYQVKAVSGIVTVQEESVDLLELAIECAQVDRNWYPEAEVSIFDRDTRLKAVWQRGQPIDEPAFG